MRGVPYPAATERDRLSFPHRKSTPAPGTRPSLVPGARKNRDVLSDVQTWLDTPDQSPPPRHPAPEDLLRQVWAARPPCWQSGDQALANALCDVRAFLIRNGDIS